MFGYKKLHSLGRRNMDSTFEEIRLLSQKIAVQAEPKCTGCYWMVEYAKCLINKT